MSLQASPGKLQAIENTGLACSLKQHFASVQYGILYVLILYHLVANLFHLLQSIGAAPFLNSTLR